MRSKMLADPQLSVLLAHGTSIRTEIMVAMTPDELRSMNVSQNLEEETRTVALSSYIGVTSSQNLYRVPKLTNPKPYGTTPEQSNCYNSVLVEHN